MSFLPCAAANCDCENFVVPKSGNPKKCADTDCGHPLGAHHSSRISTQQIEKAGEKGGQGNQIISLDDEEDSDIQVLGYQPISLVHDQSRIPRGSMVVSASTPQMIKPESEISFTKEVNRARQKASSKSLHEAQSLPKSRYAPQTVSSIIALSSRFPPPRPLQVKTTIWTRQDGNHMVKENHLQWWDFPLDNECIDYNDWFMERVRGHTGWQERKGGKLIQLDIGPTRPILIGETELKGDPTTIPVPEGGGSWRALLQNIPGFLEDLPVDEIPRGSTKKKATATALQNIRSLSIVVPTTMIGEPQNGLAPGWSPKKKKRENARKVVRIKQVKQEVRNI